jgi:hypothetical protein
LALKIPANAFASLVSQFYKEHLSAEKASKNAEKAACDVSVLGAKHKTMEELRQAHDAALGCLASKMDDEIKECSVRQLFAESRELSLSAERLATIAVELQFLSTAIDRHRLDFSNETISRELLFEEEKAEQRDAEKLKKARGKRRGSEKSSTCRRRTDEDSFERRPRAPVSKRQSSTA